VIGEEARIAAVVFEASVRRGEGSCWHGFHPLLSAPLARAGSVTPITFRSRKPQLDEEFVVAHRLGALASFIRAGAAVPVGLTSQNWIRWRGRSIDRAVVRGQIKQKFGCSIRCSIHPPSASEVDFPFVARRRQSQL
jgi:hypothetical protein